MTREILLHVGSPKCGSTYMQNVMLNNAALLEANGVRYPLTGDDHPGNAEDLQHITPEVLDRYFANGIEKVILSHEDLFSLVPHGDPLSALAAEQGIKVQLLFFLRPFSEFIYGDYSQFMKQFFFKYLESRNPYDGGDLKALALRRSETMKPHLSLRRWQHRFPKQPLIVASPRTLRSTLEGWLGAPLAGQMDWELPPGKINKSLRMQDCDALAAAMRDPSVSDKEILAMRKEAFQNLYAPDAGRTPERTAWLEELFAPQNAALLEEFGFDNRHPDHGGPS